MPYKKAWYVENKLHRYMGNGPCCIIYHDNGNPHIVWYEWYDNMTCIEYYPSGQIKRR